MSRPRRGTEQVFYDTFADWDFADQAAALKVLEALHRQTARSKRQIASASHEDDEELCAHGRPKSFICDECEIKK